MLTAGIIGGIILSMWVEYKFGLIDRALRLAGYNSEHTDDK